MLVFTLIFTLISGDGFHIRPYYLSKSGQLQLDTWGIWIFSACWATIRVTIIGGNCSRIECSRPWPEPLALAFRKFKSHQSQLQVNAFGLAWLGLAWLGLWGVAWIGFWPEAKPCTSLTTKCKQNVAVRISATSYLVALFILSHFLPSYCHITWMYLAISPIDWGIVQLDPRG